MTTKSSISSEKTKVTNDDFLKEFLGEFQLLLPWEAEVKSIELLMIENGAKVTLILLLGAGIRLLLLPVTSSSLPAPSR